MFDLSRRTLLKWGTALSLLPLTNAVQAFQGSGEMAKALPSVDLSAPLTTGIAALDEIIGGGLQPGSLNVIVGRVASGKVAWMRAMAAINSARRITEDNKYNGPHHILVMQRQAYGVGGHLETETFAVPPDTGQYSVAGDKKGLNAWALKVKRSNRSSGSITVVGLPRSRRNPNMLDARFDIPRRNPNMLDARFDIPQGFVFLADTIFETEYDADSEKCFIKILKNRHGTNQTASIEIPFLEFRDACDYGQRLA